MKPLVEFAKGIGSQVDVIWKREIESRQHIIGVGEA